MIKIDIISGFLGAGKTTFIKKMLDEVYTDEKIALIENEFGEVGIDGGFLKDSGVNITEMNSGCICCSLVGDFGRNLNEVITAYHPDRIIIEPSGVGKLSDVMKSVIDIEKEQDVKLNALVTVVNAKKALKQMKAFGEFFNNQIAFATTVVLSRTQDTAEGQLELCVKQMQALNGQAAIITTPWDRISGQQILQVMEGQDSLEMKMLADEAHRRDGQEHGHCHEGEAHGPHMHHHEDEEHKHHHEDEAHGHHYEDEVHKHHHEDEVHGHCHEDEAYTHCHGDEEHKHHHEDEAHGHHYEDEAHKHHHEDEAHGHHHEDGAHGHHHGHGGHHHHADDIFISWGKETPHKYTEPEIEHILKTLCDGEGYGEILRAKGMVENTHGGWIYFDMVPGEYEIRKGEPDYTGRICVIGTDIDGHKLEGLFGIL